YPAWRAPECGRRRWGGTQGELLLAAATAHLAYDHHPGVDADADRQAYAIVLHQTSIERSQRLHHVKASAHSSSGVVFMCLGIATVHQQTIPKVLRNMAIKALDDCSGSLLVGPYHLAPIFWVELAGEERRVNEVTEHHR